MVRQIYQTYMQNTKFVFVIIENTLQAGAKIKNKNIY